jgi:hypothetical protein
MKTYQYFLTSLKVIVLMACPDTASNCAKHGSTTWQKYVLVMGK